jgi:pantoate--beta-alanine ligase
MGALHCGHKSLIEKSVKENDRTIVSIFVNPTQFAPNEDLDSYPQTFGKDCEMCEQAGADLIFAPTREVMYPDCCSTFVDMSAVTGELCGKSRPAHFRGVCTVVNKLFNIVTPTRAYFGQKDAQQLAVIRAMVRDLNMNVEIVPCPVIRESDGLAMSSRNAYLTPTERKAATIVSKAVFEGERLIALGETSSEKVIAAMTAILDSQPLVKIDYVELTDSNSIERIADIKGSVLGAVAVYIGKTRLIDNFVRDL